MLNVTPPSPNLKDFYNNPSPNPDPNPGIVWWVRTANKSPTNPTMCIEQLHGCQITYNYIGSTSFYGNIGLICYERYRSICNSETSWNWIFKKKLWPDEKLHVFLTEVDFRIKLKNGSYHFPDRRFYLMTFKYSTNHSKTFQKSFSFTIIITKKEGIFEVHSKKNSQTNTTEKSSINSNVLTIKCYSNPEVGFPSTKFNNKIRKILKIKNWV